MGAQFVTFSAKAVDTTTLRSLFSSHQDDKTRENGTDPYGGHIGLANGLTISTKEFSDGNKAYEWLESNAQKRGPAIAVRVGDFKKSFFQKPAIVKILADLSSIKGELGSFNENIYKRALAGKSKLKACKSCESSINIRKMRVVGSPTNCPVCRENLLLTETDIARQQRLSEKLLELTIKFNGLKDKIDFKKEPSWLVGAEVRE